MSNSLPPWTTNLREAIEAVPGGETPTAEQLLCKQRQQRRQVRSRRLVAVLAAGCCVGILWGWPVPSNDPESPSPVVVGEAPNVRSVLPEAVALQSEAGQTDLASTTDATDDWIVVQFGGEDSPFVLGLDPNRPADHHPLFLTEPTTGSAIPVGYVTPPRARSIPLWQLSPAEQQLLHRDHSSTHPVSYTES